MRIDFEVIDGRSCPILICQYCCEPIRDVKSAIVKFNERNDGDPLPGEYCVYVCHKGDCDKNSPGGLGDKWPWQELGTFLIYLMHNLKMDFKEESERADLMSRI